MFAKKQLGKPPSTLALEDIGAELVSAAYSGEVEHPFRYRVRVFVVFQVIIDINPRQFELGEQIAHSG